jgi:hypothetical protein
MTCGIRGRCQAMPSRQSLDLNLSLVWDQGVGASNPLAPTILFKYLKEPQECRAGKASCVPAQPKEDCCAY